MKRKQLNKWFVNMALTYQADVTAIVVYLIKIISTCCISLVIVQLDTIISNIFKYKF